MTMTYAQEQLEKKGSMATDIQGELDTLKKEYSQVKEERSTFQTLACEKDTRISSLKSDNEAFKLKERGNRKIGCHREFDIFRSCP